MTQNPREMREALRPSVEHERRARDRRFSRDRRSQNLGPPDGERRRGSDRRCLERRETPSGHLRNAVQVLLSLSAHPRLDDESFELIVGATRRIMLALWELERR